LKWAEAEGLAGVARSPLISTSIPVDN